MKKIVTIVFGLTVLGLVAFGCTQPAINDSSDTAISSTPAINQQVNPSPADGVPASQIPQVPVPSIVRINDIIQKSADYVGKEVIIEGKIVQECGAGCWFNLKDSSAVVYVDLAPSNLTIPQKVGSNARVHGVVAIEKKTVYIIGKKVEFK